MILTNLPFQNKTEKFVVPELELDYCSNKINKNRYKKTFSSIKKENNSNVAEEQIASTENCSYLVT